MTAHESEKKSSGWRSRPFRFDLLMLLVGLVLATGLAIGAYSYSANSKSALELSATLAGQASTAVIEKTTQYLLPAKTMTRMTSDLLTVTSLDIVRDREVEAYLLNVLMSIPQLAMVYIGGENGDFVKAERQAGGGFITQTIDRSGSVPKTILRKRDSQGRKISEESQDKAEYDPRDRPWYKAAASAEASGCWTDIYRFFTGGYMGITAAVPAYGKSAEGEKGPIRAVSGADITLDELSTFLGTLRIGKSGLALIVDDKRQVVAYSLMASDKSAAAAMQAGEPLPVEKVENEVVSAAFRQRAESGLDHLTVATGGASHLAYFTAFPSTFAKKWEVAIIVPEDDFIGQIKHTNIVSMFISIAVLIVAVVCAILLSRGLSRPIQALTAEMRRIREFNLDGRAEITSHIQEVQDMSEALKGMKSGLAAFRKYVPADLVRQLIERGEEARLGGSRQEITLLFTESANFTTIAEMLPPETMAELDAIKQGLEKEQAVLVARRAEAQAALAREEAAGGVGCGVAGERPHPYSISIT